MSTTIPTPTNTNMTKIITKTIGLDLIIGKPSAQRTVKSNRFRHTQGNVDPDSLNVSKKLLNSKEFKAINTIDGKMGVYLRKTALPSFLRRGIYLLSLDLVDQVDMVITDYKGVREEAINAFISVYPSLIEEDKTKLGPEFNSEDYPTPEMLRTAFYVSARYISLETPDKLENVNATIFKREKERVSQMWDSAADNIKDLLRYSFQELLDKMVTALRPAEDGGKKKFRTSTANNLLEFMATFDPRNITNDEELAALVTKCKGILGAGNPDLLRRDKDLKEQTYTALAEVKAQVDAMAIVKPRRKIKLEEESNAC